MKTNIYTINPEQYPGLLPHISRLPKKLEVSGLLPNIEYKFLCIIGSRENSAYGKEVCNRLIKGLQGYPIVIVSGLAIGIDSIAHEIALKYSIKTIAFPGSGLALDVLYPGSHRSLALKIVESGGALISPFERHQKSTVWTFPFRNRLMAGISHATLIIEARKGSGTLLTAEYAAEFNRDILAVPGSIFSDLSYGPHMLIERGAIPVTSSKDILEALGFAVAKESNQQSLLSLAELSLSEQETNILALLKSSPHTGSNIINLLQLTSSAFNMSISELEIKGIVEERGGLYCIKNS